MRRRDTRLIVIRATCYAVIFITVLFLFYEESTGAYRSDLFKQIQAAISPTGDSYTITKPLFRFLYAVSGYFGVAFFLALCEIGTIAVSEMMLRRLMPSIKPSVVLATAVMCNFAIAIYLPFVHRLLNVGVSEGNEWHNATYTVMRLCAMLALWFFVKFDEKAYGQKASVLSWLLFSVFSVLATASKPSFVIVFIPALVLFCVLDIVENGKSALRKDAWLAVSMIIALLIVWYQYTVLYASDGNSGIGVGFAVVWRARHPNLIIALLQSYAFLLCVLGGCWHRLRSDRVYRLAFIMFLVGLVQYLVFFETGARSSHGNFDWGLCFAVYYLTLVSAAVFLEDKVRFLPFALSSSEPARQMIVADDDGRTTDRFGTRSCLQGGVGVRAYCNATIAVFALHVLSGLYYYARLLAGLGYR
jgi:hypothetical protein